MDQIAGWVALIATSAAALLTAANLGPRVTGWGFAVFAMGAVAWIVVGAITDQAQLLYSNIFLGLVDLFGVWRWLGRQAHTADAAKAEEVHSASRSGENLFSLATLEGLPVRARSGQVVAHAVDAMAGCANGRIDFLLVRSGGVAGMGEKLRRLPWSEAELRSDHVRTTLNADAFDHLSLAVSEP